MDPQITERINDLIEVENRDAFRRYCERVFAIVAKVVDIDNRKKEELIPPMQQAFEKGISPERLADLVTQTLQR